MVSKSVIQAIASITIRKSGQDASPHKFALLLAIISLVKDNKILDNKLLLNEELEQRFIQKAVLLRPDLHEDDIHIEYPFYYMSLNGYWTLKVIPGKESAFREIQTEKNHRFTKKRLLEMVAYAIISDDLILSMSNKEDCETLENIILEAYNRIISDSPVISNMKDNLSELCYSDYLSSLISTNPCNENAIAETQSVNPQFRTIHIEHPLVEQISQELKNNLGKHIIITGHAGDGKTTIAIDILQRLKGLNTGISLSEPLLPREDLDDPRITILKDFSEREERADLSLIDELKSLNRRFLIISNTGTLLSFFREHAKNWDLSPVQAESKILTAISAEGGFQELEFSGIEFMVFNLALMDNLELAKAIFSKMIRTGNWESCTACSKQRYCPIYQNVSILQTVQEQVVDRLFLIYRRLHEYGNRLTIRQITSHMAYLLSSGLNFDNVHENMGTLGSEYLFFNRMYGDDGKSIDNIASEMKAIVELRRQTFGELLNSKQEMNLWLRPVADTSIAVHSSVAKVFSKLRKVGISSLAPDDSKISPDNARMQVRRLLFFFIQGESESKEVISAYLKSSNIMRWQAWQKDGARLDNAYKTRYANMIYHVIQEYFTGIKIPEGIGYQDGRLYITLSRKQNEVRQSAQIVIAEFDWSQSISLDIVRSASAIGAGRSELALVGKGLLDGISLKLGLPFLDYVTQRHYGEIGELLKASYRERLERFKTQILGKTAYGKDEMMIVRLRNDNNFKRQKYAVKSQYLEVYDV
jgi:hypothetical protein